MRRNVILRAEQWKGGRIFIAEGLYSLTVIVVPITPEERKAAA